MKLYSEMYIFSVYSSMYTLGNSQYYHDMGHIHLPYSALASFPSQLPPAIPESPIV